MMRLRTRHVVLINQRHVMRDVSQKDANATKDVARESRERERLRRTGYAGG